MTKPQLQSWHQTQRSLGRRQAEVIELLSHSAYGMSAWEIATKTGRFVHAVRPRLTELRNLGLIREVGERWEPRTDRNEAIWKVVPWDEDGQMKMAI